MKLILFDIDGTILKFDNNLSKKIFSEIIEDIFGKSLSDDKMPNFSGMTDLKIIYDTAKLLDISKEVVDYLLPEVYREMVERFTPEFNLNNIEILPGVTDLLMYFNYSENYQLGLLTGNYIECAYLKLKPFGLDKFFPFGAFGNEHYDRNLLPEIALLRANSYVGNDVFSVNNTIIIGDSPKDIECAKSNNISSISVATGHFPIDELKLYKPDYCFESLVNTDDLIKIIESINEKDNNSY